MSDIAKIREALELAIAVGDRSFDSTTSDYIGLLNAAEEALRLFDKMVSEEAVAWIAESENRTPQFMVDKNDIHTFFGGSDWSKRPLYASPFAQPKVPEAMETAPFQTVDKGSKNYAAGWNACRMEMLSELKDQS